MTLTETSETMAVSIDQDKLRVGAGLKPARTELREDAHEVGARNPSPAIRYSLLVLLGGISGVAYYLGFVTPYRLDEYYNEPLQDLAKINGHTAAAANEWALTWIVLFACYYLAFRICPSSATISRAFRRVGLFLICGWAAF